MSKKKSSKKKKKLRFKVLKKLILPFATPDDLMILIKEIVDMKHKNENPPAHLKVFEIPLDHLFGLLRTLREEKK